MSNRAPRPTIKPSVPTHPVSTTRPHWTSGAPTAEFWIGTPDLPNETKVVIIGGDRVPYDGEQVPVRDPDPDGVRASPMGVGDGAVVTHCRDIPHGRITSWARTGWLVPDDATDAPWLGATFPETDGSDWDYCRSVGGNDLICWHDGVLPPAAPLPGRPSRLPTDLIPAGLTDPLAPGRAFCRRSPDGGQLCWLAYPVPDGRLWRPVVPVDPILSAGRPNPAVACRFGADRLGRDRAFCAATAEDAALIAAEPDRQPVHQRPDGSLCVRHTTSEACWAPRPDISQHRPATWYLP